MKFGGIQLAGLFPLAGLLVVQIAGAAAFGQTASTPGDSARTPAIANGLYLVQRWTTQKADLLPLLEGEMLVEHDPRRIEPESQDPVLYVTIGTGERVLFEKLRSIDPVTQDDGRINLQVTLSRASADRLEALSRQYLGRQVATVIDGRALTLHKVRSIIRNGQLQITRCTDDGCRVILQQLRGDR